LIRHPRGPSVHSATPIGPRRNAGEQALAICAIAPMTRIADGLPDSVAPTWMLPPSGSRWVMMVIAACFASLRPYGARAG
jgi:hypothetical protein